MMLRADAVAVLERVAPALSTKDLVPVFACFCFDGKTVTAYNDLVALSSPIGWDIRGGVRGKDLLSWLKVSRAETIETTVAGTEVTFKLGRTQLKQPLIPEKDFLFAFPKDEGTAVAVGESFVSAMKKCRVCMGMDPSSPWAAGITMVVDDGLAELFSTNHISAVRATVKMDVKDKRRTLFPAVFCDLFVAMAGREKIKSLILGDGWVEVRYESGLRLFSRTGREVNLENYDEVFTGETLDLAKEGVDMPSGLQASLERGLIIIAGVKDRYTEMDVVDGVARLFTQSPSGEIEDLVKMPNHPDVSPVGIIPVYVLDALPFADKIRLTASAILLKGSQFSCIVAVEPKDAAKPAAEPKPRKGKGKK